jgi:hypothetical protein
MADTPTPVSAVTTSAHDDGVVLLHTVDGRLFSANRTGACVWRGLEARLPVDAMAAELNREYGIPSDVAREHVMQFLMQLERHRLIERRGRK